MNKDRNYYKNTYHHLYNRGANKAAIFYERENYLFFLRRMKYYADKYKIKILSYCLMPNHFHIFLKQTTNDYPITHFLSTLLNSYVKSMNKKYEHSGTLFEGKTKSKQIDDEDYFVWVIKYILENPVHAHIVENIADWDFSNAKDLLGMRNGNLTDTKYVTSFFQSKESMIKFLTDKTIKINYEF
ncbi:MAG: transposase [Ignavibacteriaceae bacterium]|nr:transposase [Ignavibacteriaceae bacterium]